MALFIGAELLLAMAIPFLAIAGYHALIDSRAGRFVEEAGPADPGWRAVVDPSPLVAVVEMENGRLTGIALLAGHIDESAGGTVILVPGTLTVGTQTVGEQRLVDLAPEEAVAAIGAALRLRIPSFEVVDGERWPSVLGDSSYVMDNPDPVVGDSAETLLAVGPTDVGGANAALFLGRPAPDSDPITLNFRRHLFWTSVVADPPTTDDPLVAWILEVSGPSAQVVDLPLIAIEPNPSLDLASAEVLIREVVPVPAGASPGDRIQVRVIDRTGTADLPAIAAKVASTGAEVVEIGNAQEFDGGTTVVVVPAGVDGPEITELALLAGAATVSDDEVDGDSVVTLLIGVDFVTSR